ncbi:MAG: cob(I)yrinic acid a,c-diamide adenosyltransferase [Alphaproteobacteria bacterium]|nr:MAG: cob(I)yrinic acid a,c-diamide adenosyltransferase [Alphaproteobacteria bacterium]
MKKCPYVTKTGDKGKTSIIGKRADKNSTIIQFLGSLDEVNCYIGMVRNYADSNLTNILITIQNQLLNVGANVSGSEIIINEKYTEWVEEHIEHFYQSVGETHNFVLPGGSILSSFIHITRAIIRRSETLLWSLENINPHVATYMNRLSDLFFVLGRFTNEQEDIVWKVGQLNYE